LRATQMGKQAEKRNELDTELTREIDAAFKRVT